MACSRYTYVKDFESHTRILPGSYFIVRLDGRNFSSFSNCHNFTKPNDKHGLQLLNKAAAIVMNDFSDIILTFTQSDEVSFVFSRDAPVFGRRESKILSTVVSLFTGAYVMHWHEFMRCELKQVPVFDGRIVCYPGNRYVRDYLSWRQADVHVNNLYNTCFWKLVEDGVDKTQAELLLRGTVSSEKNELLFSRFQINYAKEPVVFRKGSVIVKRPTNVWHDDVDKNQTRSQAETVGQVLIQQKKYCIVVLHEDIIGDKFWSKNPYILGPAL